MASSTQDAFTALGAGTGGGIEWRLTLCIEGIDCILTNATPAQALAAHSGTDHTVAVGGLVVQSWGQGQEIRPWSTKLSINTLTIGVVPEPGVDTFGKMAFNTAGGVETRLVEDLDCTETGITVKRADDFAASGDIHIGTECIGYSSRDTGTDVFTVAKRGKYHPLRTGGFGRPHPLPSFEGHVNLLPAVTSLPRQWAGRLAALYLHQVVGGTLATRANAVRLFVGKIVGIPREDENGVTWLELEDIRGTVRDCMLLRDQYTATVDEGVFLAAGMIIDASSKTDTTVLNANALTVVAASPGTNEVLEGIYSYDEICTEILNPWLADEVTAGRLHYTTTFGLVETDAGLRTQISINGGSAGDRLVTITLPTDLWIFLGWSMTASQETKFFPFTTTNAYPQSDGVPFRSYVSWTQLDGDFANLTLPLKNEAGTFFANEEYLPIEMRVSDTDVGLFQIEGQSGLLLATMGSGELHPISYTDRSAARGAIGESANISAALGKRMDSNGEIGVKQVAVLAGRFGRMVERFLMSTGTAGHNGTADVFPMQLGAAIPEEVLDEAFHDQILALDQSTADMMVILEKPTRLWDVLSCGFVLRAANLVWDPAGGADTIGGLGVARWSTPTTTTALHNFTHEDKAAPSNTKETHRTVAGDDDAYVGNIVKVEFNRSLAGSGSTYDANVTVADRANMEEQGQRSFTIKERNTYSGWRDSNIAELVGEVAGWMPLFGRPLRVLRRSINLGRFLSIVPGDHCTISDPFVRNPETGERGISGWPGLILAVRPDWGGSSLSADGTGQRRAPIGEVEIMLWPRNRFAPYSPCAQVDDTATDAGYNAISKLLTCYAHKHSDSAQAVDAANFAIGDKIVVIEIDPSDPAAPLSWSDTVANRSGNVLTMTTGLAGWDTTKRYRVISAAYGTAVATQKTDVYQADDADGLIVDVAQAYELALNPNPHTFTEEDPADIQVALHSEVYWGDGKPLDTGSEYDVIRLANNYRSFRAAPSIPSMSTKVETQTGACVRAIKKILPITMHPGDLGRGSRYLWVRPFYRSGTGASVTITVSLCRGFPFGTSMVITDADAPEYRLSAHRESETWTTSSTTWAHGAAYPFSFENLNADGNGWLVLEVTQNAETRGFSEVRAGPFLREAA